MIDFPNSPTVGQIFTNAGTTWQWDGAKWLAQEPAAQAIVAGAPPTGIQGDLWWDDVGGQLYIYYDDGTSAQWVQATNLPNSAIVVPVSVLQGGTGATTAPAALTNLGAAPIASPALTGTPTAPTAAPSTNTTQLATTAFVQGGFAPLNNPVFTGDPRAPTPVATDNDTSIATTAFVQSVGGHNAGRNLFHNPQFLIGQRGGGPWTAAGAYTLDRWVMNLTNDTLSVSLQYLADTDRAAIGDEAVYDCLQCAFTGSATAGSFSQIAQRVEGTRRLSNKPVTVSFWARATSGTPKISLAWAQIFGTGGSPSATVVGNLGVTPNLSATWQRYTITGTIPSIAGKTYGTNLGTDYTQFAFWLSDQGNQSAGSIGVQSGTVQFWGMQLEIGSSATPLEKLDPQIDLANCQRFYQTAQIYRSDYAGASASLVIPFNLPVQLRAASTVVLVSIGGGGLSSVVGGSYGLSLIYVSCTATPGGWSLTAAYQASADL